jgi:DNA-binding MarR family transcriptional regulator
MRQDPTADSFDAMVAARATNLRQLLQAAIRRLNVQIANALRSDGYADITATHTMLLSNMTLKDDTVTSIAHRASVSAQAVGRLVRELEERGYLRTAADVNDARRRPIVLTARGRKLMQASFKILAEIENRLGDQVDDGAIDILRHCLFHIASD